MTLEQLYNRLAATGLPLVYGQFEDLPTPPYIVYVANGVNEFYADGRVYFSATRVIVSLFTKCKDMQAEATLETALLGLSYKKVETYYSDEKIYEITYELEV